MSRWRQISVNKIRVILLVPRMQLEDQVTVTIDPIINIAMLVLRECADLQQLPIPAAACPHVSHCDQRLRPNDLRFHFGFVRQTSSPARY